MSRPWIKDALSKLLRDSIVQLCRVSVGLTADFELDAIICVSTPRRDRDDDQQIVVKIHELIACHGNDDSDSSGQNGSRGRAASYRLPSASAGWQSLSKRRRRRRSPSGDRNACRRTVTDVRQRPSQEARSENKECWPAVKDELAAVRSGREEAIKREPMGVEEGPEEGRLGKFDDGSGMVGLVAPVRCGECSHMFAQRTALSQHVVDAHGVVMTYFCDACSVGFASETLYSEHRFSTGHEAATFNESVHDEPLVNVNHSNGESSIGQLPEATTRDSADRIPDDLANWTATEQTDAGTIIDLSDDTGAADICESEFISRLPDGGLMFRCDTCESMHASLAEHSTHVQSVHMRCACPHCARTFSKTSSRNRHASTAHSPAKLFACRLCNTGYTRANTLRKHCERVHGLDTQDASIAYMNTAKTEAMMQP